MSDPEDNKKFPSVRLCLSHRFRLRPVHKQLCDISYAINLFYDWCSLMSDTAK